MAEHKTTYDFVEVKAGDILAERQAEWHGFTTFVTWSTGTIAVVLLLMLIFLG
ncbi:aa3-type cytochrome c oxidase subunit IV [Roseomonas sp. CAU 1739]|uniref:aa3-type cytochrome c oxidase subunit IV n=1 Tax=Roseomonas sp. CAU 1739 TaxID=3140364 RepID=UPI00325ACF06